MAHPLAIDFGTTNTVIARWDTEADRPVSMRWAVSERADEGLQRIASQSGHTPAAGAVLP